MNAEAAETLAGQLLAYATLLGELESLVRRECGTCDQMRENPEAVDLLTGPEIAETRAACRSLAMAIDRAALVKFNPETVCIP